MAQVEYSATDSETWRLVEQLIVQFEARFTPERHRSARFPEFTELKDVVDYARKEFRTRFFVTSPQWGTHPFKIKRLLTSEHHYFYLDLGHGGPYFDHCPAGYYSDARKNWMVPGMFSDRPIYRSDEGDIARPPQMAKAFSQIKRFILKSSEKSRCVEKGFQGPYISPGAREYFESGGWLRIGDWHFEPFTRKKRSI